MAWTVTEAATPHRRNQSSAQREYIIVTDGENGDTVSVQGARAALINSLETEWAEEYTANQVATGKVRDLTAQGSTPFRAYDPVTPAVHDRYLGFFLHGLPIRDANITDTEGKDTHFRATVSWGTSTQNNSTAANQNTVNLLASGGGSIATTHTVSVTTLGRQLDFTNKVAVLTHLWSELTFPTIDGNESFFPLYQVGAINATETEPDGPILVSGVQYTPPQPDITVSFDLSGAEVTSNWVNQTADFVKEGRLNVDPFTIAGITFSPLQLLLSSLNVDRAASGTTRIDVGFSVANTTAYAVNNNDDVNGLVGENGILPDIDNPGGTRYGDFFMYEVDADEFLFTTPKEPPEDDVVELIISGHDYYWPFIKQMTEADQQKKNIRIKNELHFANFHRIFKTTNFGPIIENDVVTSDGIFGSASI